VQGRVVHINVGTVLQQYLDDLDFACIASVGGSNQQDGRKSLAPFL